MSTDLSLLLLLVCLFMSGRNLPLMTFGLVRKPGGVYQFITRLMYTNKAIWRNQLTKCAVFTLRGDTQFYILTICCKQQQAPFLFILSVKMSTNRIAAKRKCCNIETPQTYKKIDLGSM